MSTLIKVDTDNEALLNGIFQELYTDLDENENGLSAYNILQELNLDNGQINEAKKYIRDCKNVIKKAYSAASGSQESYLEEDLMCAKKLKDILDLYRNNIVSGDTNG